MNLWADFDNSHLFPEAARPGKSRRLTDSVILSSIRDWLLHAYVPPYCHSLANLRIYRRCYWLDAWGSHSRTSQPPQSSQTPIPEEILLSSTNPTNPTNTRKKERAQPLPPPLQPIVSLSQTLAREERAIALYGIVLDAGKEGQARQNGNRTKEKAITLPRESGIVRASWVEAAPFLLKDIEQSPTIFLLNPLAPVLLSYDQLLPLYQRTTAPTELFFLLSHKQLEARLQAAFHHPETASALSALLRTDRWKSASLENDKHSQAIEYIISLLSASMERHFLTIQPITLAMQIGPAVVENVPYTLLFATRNKESLIQLNDAVCMRRRHLSQESHRGVLGEDWFLTQQQEREQEALEALHSRIAQQGHSQHARRWPDLRQQILLSHFGQFLLYEYDETIRQLLASGEVRCRWRKSIVAEGDTTRIPGNEDTLVWT